MAHKVSELQHLKHFAEMNGMMNWSFEDVLNEYQTTKDFVED